MLTRFTQRPVDGRECGEKDTITQFKAVLRILCSFGYRNISSSLFRFALLTTPSSEALALNHLSELQSGHTTRVNPPHQRSRQENPPFAPLDLTSRILFKNSKTAPDGCSIATRNSRLFVGLSFVPLDDLS